MKENVPVGCGPPIAWATAGPRATSRGMSFPDGAPRPLPQLSLLQPLGCNLPPSSPLHQMPSVPSSGKDYKRPRVENMTAGGRGSDGRFVRARRRHRRWRRRYQSWSRVNTTDPTDSFVHAAADRSEPANYTDSCDVATVDRSELASGARLLGHDSSTLTMGPHNLLPGRDIMDDPMLEEFVASLAASRITTCPTLDHLASTPVAT